MSAKFSQWLARFWSKVNKSGPVVRAELGPCWIWTGGLIGGYGRACGPGDGVHRRAHRVAWELTHSAIPRGMFACHRCDNRACVNPAHLFLGTALENNRDARAKGRSSRPPRTKLTPDAVRAIRRRLASGELQKTIAQSFGVGHVAISDIANGRTWTHVRDEASP